MPAKSLWPLALVCLSGCMVMSHGFNRDRLEMRLREDDKEVKVTDEEIARIQSLKAQVRFPCRIAVALYSDHCEWRWAAKDRKMIEGWAEGLKKDGVASDVVFMSSMFTHGGSVKEVRAAAAKYGADAVLLVRGAAATEDRMNPLALLNCTVVGGFVVPGSHRDALFRLEGVLVDVNNGYLYATAEAEGEGSVLAPTFLIEARDAVERAKEAALQAFGPELLRRLRALKAPCPAPVVRK